MTELLEMVTGDFMLTLNNWLIKKTSKCSSDAVIPVFKYKN